MPPNTTALYLLGLRRDRPLRFFDDDASFAAALRLLETLDVGLALRLVVDDRPRVRLAQFDPAFVRSPSGRATARTCERRQLGQLGDEAVDVLALGVAHVQRRRPHVERIIDAEEGRRPRAPHATPASPSQLKLLIAQSASSKSRSKTSAAPRPVARINPRLSESTTPRAWRGGGASPVPAMAHGRINQRIARSTLLPGLEALLCGGVGVPVDVFTNG